MDAKHLGSQPFSPVPYDDADQHQGITLRQHFAGLALQGLLASGRTGEFALGELAEGYATSLLESLAKTRP